jgi:hypothetical protein
MRKDGWMSSWRGVPVTFGRSALILGVLVGLPGVVMAQGTSPSSTNIPLRRGSAAASGSRSAAGSPISPAHPALARGKESAFV